jgi:Helix-turn-helix domain
LAGVSVDYDTRLERGNARGASDTVLEALARALQLDEAERAHLFDLIHTEALDLTDDGMRITVHTAEPGTPSADALNLLASWAATLEQGTVPQG